MASNLRRSKRTIGRRLSYVEAKLNVSRRANIPKKLAPGSVTSPSLSPDVSSTLNTIQTTADGKNSIYRQATEPSGGSYTEGDLWFDTDDGNKFYRYTSGLWTGFTLGDSALASISANKLTAGTIDASVITVSNINAGNIVTGTLSSIELRAGTPVGGLYPFRVTTAGAVRAVSGTIGAFSLSSTTLTASNLDTGLSGVSSTIELATSGQIKTRVDVDSVFGPDYYTEVYINKASTSGGIVVTGDASGTALTSTILSSQIQTRQFVHDAYTDAGGYGKFTAYGSHVYFGNGSTMGYTMRVVLDNNLYGQGTGGATTLDVLVNANGTLVAPSSSIRFKENVNNLDVDYKKVLAIQPVTFQYKDDSEVLEGAERATEYGVIAEQVEEAGVPELVTYKDGLPFAVPYSKMPIFLLEVCRKQEEKIEELESRISELEK